MRNNTVANRLISRRQIPSNDIDVTLWHTLHYGGVEVIIEQGQDNSVVLYDKEDINTLIQALQEIKGYLR